MRLLRYIPTGIAAILAMILVAVFIQFKSTQSDLSYWRNEATTTAQLYHVADSVAARRAQENTKLKTQNAELNGVINNQKETIRSLTTINGELETALTNAETTVDTLWLDNNVAEEIRRFEESPDPFYLRGYFKIRNPYTITFEKITAQVDLEVALTEDKYEGWRAYVTSTNPNFTVTDIVPQVNPYEPTWQDKLKFNLGAYGGNERLGVMAGATYDKHSLLLGFDTQGSHIGYMRSFGLK